jgi:hypothetical protein
MHSALNCEMRDGIFVLLHVSDAAVVMHRRAPDVMDVAAQFPSITYVVFAGSISINNNRTASNCSAISWRNSPHRQQKFAIGHNNSLIAIRLRIHAAKCVYAHRPSGTYQSFQ